MLNNFSKDQDPKCIFQTYQIPSGKLYFRPCSLSQKHTLAPQVLIRFTSVSNRPSNSQLAS